MMGIEYPKKHDACSALERFTDRFPSWFNTERLAERREPAIYGDEATMTPADLLFTKKDATEALRIAKDVFKTANRLIQEYEKSKPDRE